MIQFLGSYNDTPPVRRCVYEGTERLDIVSVCVHVELDGLLSDHPTI